MRRLITRLTGAAVLATGVFIAGCSDAPPTDTRTQPTSAVPPAKTAPPTKSKLPADPG